MKRNTKKIVSEVKDEGKTIGSIKFGKFIPEKVYRVDFEAEENVMETFAKYGLEKIKDDQEALVSYAINKLLKDMIESDGKNMVKIDKKCKCKECKCK